MAESAEQHFRGHQPALCLLAPHSDLAIISLACLTGIGGHLLERRAWYALRTFSNIPRFPDIWGFSFSTTHFSSLNTGSSHLIQLYVTPYYPTSLNQCSSECISECIGHGAISSADSTRIWSLAMQLQEITWQMLQLTNRVFAE